jgi:lysyl-tRNA synthetase class 2
MMHPIVRGAAARPFVTLATPTTWICIRELRRSSSERLVAGGLERVYDQSQFRNEGTAEHNPEFTMLEFYQAYSDYHDLMDLTRNCLVVGAESLRTTTVKYGDTSSISGNGSASACARRSAVTGWRAGGRYRAKNWRARAALAPGRAPRLAQTPGAPTDAPDALFGWQSMSDGELTGLLFETVAEPKLIQPTLLYDFPTDISPLAKCRPDDPSLVERFEVFVGGMELGNAFSELNDPDEQEKRLRRQVSHGGDEVPREVDLDYVRALAHGLPPTAGMGIGIDRLTMLFTDSRSIREVILFPLLRPEASDQTSGAAAEPAGKSGSNP